MLNSRFLTPCLHIGFTYGNPVNWPFTPWVAQSPNLIIVSIYYRLDSLGFLSHPAMASSDLNAGLQDQLQALIWIHEYIGKFGGDKNQITISGESAGATSVEFLLIMDEERTNGLYNAAILQSVGRIPLPQPEEQVVSHPVLTIF
jgi:carboxylesterase type B